MTMTIVSDADPIDDVHATTEEMGITRRHAEITSMKTQAATGSGHGTRGPAAGSHWWKAWVLVTSLGATVLGWMAFAMTEPPANLAVVAPDARPAPTQAPPARHASGLEQPGPLPASAGMLPVMPQKPIFQAPVTRTRRS